MFQNSGSKIFIEFLGFSWFHLQELSKPFPENPDFIFEKRDPTKIPQKHVLELLYMTLRREAGQPHDIYFIYFIFYLSYQWPHFEVLYFYLIFFESRSHPLAADKNDIRLPHFAKCIVIASYRKKGPGLGTKLSIWMECFSA